MIIRNLRLLILNVLLPYLVSDVAAGSDPISPPPKMLAPIPFPKRLIFREQLVRTCPLEILYCSRHRELRRNPNWHMHMIAVDRPCVDRHLVSARNLAQKLSGPLPDISAQDWKTVLCDPHDMVLAVPDRVTFRLRILHTRSVASQSPKGEGFTDPGEGTLKTLSLLHWETEEQIWFGFAPKLLAA